MARKGDSQAASTAGQAPPEGVVPGTVTLRERLQAELAPDNETSLLDLVDNLLGKGVVVDGEVVLGLAGVDLIYLRLAALLAAADRVTGGREPLMRSVDSGAAPDVASPPTDDRRRERRSPAIGEGVELLDLPDMDEEAAPTVQVRPAPQTAVPAQGETVTAPSRWNPDPEEVRKGVMKLVLALAEFIRQLLERQAIRRMEAGTLSEADTERLGTALAQLEETLREMAERAGLDPAEVNLDLGPLGKLV